MFGYTVQFFLSHDQSEAVYLLLCNISRLGGSLTLVSVWQMYVQATPVVRVPLALIAGPPTCAVVQMALWHRTVRHPFAQPPSLEEPMSSFSSQNSTGGDSFCQDCTNNTPGGLEKPRCPEYHA